MKVPPGAVGLLVLIASAPAWAPAWAQAGPGFDCAKASNALEREICRDPQSAGDDREMADAYAALAAKLSGPARDHLVADQARWVAGRNRACAKDADAFPSCLRYAERIANLGTMAGGLYPFIGEHAILKGGAVGKIGYAIDVRYPQFDGPTIDSAADFSAINRRFADAAAENAGKATPTAGSGIDRARQWTYREAFTLDRLGPNVIAVVLNVDSFTGGAHPDSRRRCTLVDLGTGKAVGPDGVFAPGDAWHALLVRIVGRDLKERFAELRDDDALLPALGGKLRDPAHYRWHAAGLEVIFNRHDLGPNAYSVEVAYGQLKPVLRAGGPLGDK